MHNWWLASLEHFGLITRDQAEHIATEIKNSIHKDKYVEAYDDLGAILDQKKVGAVKLFDELEAKYLELKDEVEKLKASHHELKTTQPPLVTEVDPNLPQPENIKVAAPKKS